MAVDPTAPVIVGAGQLVVRDPSDPRPAEPVAMMAHALRLAAEDSGVGERLLRRADSVRCVPVIAWRYGDAGALVSQDLGVTPRETVASARIGGDGPQRLVNDTAQAIADGELDVALIAGAEAVAALRVAPSPPWRSQADGIHATRVLDEDRPPLNETEAAARVELPVTTYALLESAVRAAEGDSPDRHLASIAGLWSRFSDVAAGNPHAWITRSVTAEEIATPSPDNRLVASPYTKLLTANMQVNLGAGLILCSARGAEAAGVPRDRWVFVHAGAQAHDEWHVSERASLAGSPAIRAVGRGALEHAQIGIEDVAHLDLYSCFPSAVQIAARELGLSIDDPARPLTVTGGLTFAGGPGNNHSAHAIARLVGRLRADPDAYGFVSAMGWYVTKHAVGVYSARPPRRPFASLRPVVGAAPARRALPDYAGAATLEAYTVLYARDGAPEAAVMSALTPDGDRTLLRTTDSDTVAALSRPAEEYVGRRIVIGADRLAVDLDVATRAR